MLPIINGSSISRAFPSAILFLLISFSATTQSDTLSINKKGLVVAGASVAVAYAGTLTVLSKAWYNGYNRQPFHFFNDAGEWKQMDKAGHFYSAFHVSSIGSSILQSCHVNTKRSDLIAGATGFLMLSSIEVLDGYSAGYGASWSDLVANASGTFFLIGQGMLWNEVRIHPKFSFHATSLAKARPELLGSGLEEILKDYNGQTYWLSIDMDKFMRFPAWLNLSLGYGAEQMIYARDLQNLKAGYVPYRKFYLSLDIDPTAVRTKSRFIKAVIKGVNMIRIPAPALEFSEKGIKFHPLYF